MPWGLAWVRGKEHLFWGIDSGCLDNLQVQGVYPPTLQSGFISISINPSRGCFLSLFYKKPCLFFQNCLILPRFGVFPGNACPEICLFMCLYTAEREGAMGFGMGTVKRRAVLGVGREVLVSRFPFFHQFFALLSGQPAFIIEHRIQCTGCIFGGE